MRAAEGGRRNTRNDIDKNKALSKRVRKKETNGDEAVGQDNGEQLTCGRQDIVDEDKDGLLRAQLDSPTDDIDKLADGEVAGDKVPVEERRTL